MAIDLNLKTLRYFVAVIDAGSLSRAARQLFIAQPALTARMKKLENELEVQLLERSATGVTPTAAGSYLYEDACDLLQQAKNIQRRIRQSSNKPTGSVTLALPFLLASLLTGPLLAQMSRRYPHVRVFILDDLSVAVQEALGEGRADLGILVDQDEEQGLKSYPLVREAIYFCGRDDNELIKGLLWTSGRRNHLGRHVPDIWFEETTRLPLLTQSRRFAMRRGVEKVASGLGLTLNIAHEHDSTRVLRSLCLDGAGFAYVPACAVRGLPAPDPRWISARVIKPELARSYYLATPAAAPSNLATEAVKTILLDQVHETIASGLWDASWLADAWLQSKKSK